MPVSAQESSFAPISVCHLNALAINPSSISVTRLMVIKIAKRDACFSKTRYKIYGNATILYKERIFGMVQKVFEGFVGNEQQFMCIAN